MVDSTSSHVIQDLAAHRVKKLEQENTELKAYVASVMQQLNENDTLFAKLFDLEAKILMSVDVEALCFTLLRELKKTFSVDMVRLWFERSSFLGECRLSSISKNDLVWIDQGDIISMGLPGKPVWLLRLRQVSDFPWLRLEDENLNSMALLLLGDGQQSFGVLALGSQSETRFQPKQSTDFLQHLAQIISLTLENAVTRERLAMLSVTDSLTGIHNRRFFQPHSHQHVSQWFGKGICVACIYCSVDGFKQVNDELGDATADKVLLIVSKRIQRYIRSQDTLIRMGDHEFVVFLPACRGEKAAEIACRMLGNKPMTLGKKYKLGLSIGVSFSSAKADKLVNVLVKESDQAKHIAKALGGHRVEIANT